MQRLTDVRPDDKTGLSGRHAPPLFDYGASVRRELEQFIADLDPDVADEPRTFVVQSGEFVLTPRKLLFHCVLHEFATGADCARRPPRWIDATGQPRPVLQQGAPLRAQTTATDTTEIRPQTPERHHRQKATDTTDTTDTTDIKPQTPQTPPTRHHRHKATDTTDTADIKPQTTQHAQSSA